MLIGKSSVSPSLVRTLVTTLVYISLIRLMYFVAKAAKPMEHKSVDLGGDRG
jgi:hypothetical protein